jgi:hypothetical protein
VEAATLKVAIQSSSRADEVLASMVESLRHLRSVTTESYYTRVTSRLSEVLPEEFVPRLAASLRIDAAASSAA